MPVIAVVNCKGGSGKSTLATNLASYFACIGTPVMLGDADRQQSTASWLRERAARALIQGAPIVGWAVDPQRVMRPPPGVRHVVLDMAGGLRGFELARVVACADAVLVPVGHSAFDRESSAACIAELLALPRVASGHCRVGVVGMRLDARTRAAESLAAWALHLKVPFLGALRETQAYVRCAESGLGVFDLPVKKAEIDVAQWQPIVAWLDKALRELRRPVVGGQRVVPKALPSGTLRSAGVGGEPVARAQRPLALPIAATRVMPASRAAEPALQAAPVMASAGARRGLGAWLSACLGWLPVLRIAHR